MRAKPTAITALFILGALGFALGLLPALAEVFWILWFLACGACITGLVLAVTWHSPLTAPESSARERAYGAEAGSSGAEADLSTP